MSRKWYQAILIRDRKRYHTYSWGYFSIFKTFIVFVSFSFSFFLYNQCKFCETKKCYVIFSLQVQRIGIIADIDRVIMVIFHFWVECCQKYASHQKKFQIKVVRNWILSKKVCKHICFPPEWHDIVLKWQNAFNLGLNVAKITHHTKKKSFKLNLFGIEFRTKKSASAYVYLSPEKDWYGEILYWNNKLHLE